MGKKEWSTSANMSHNSECSGGVHPLNRTFFERGLNQRFAAKKKLAEARKQVMVEAKKNGASEEAGAVVCSRHRSGIPHLEKKKKEAWGEDVESTAEAKQQTWMLKKTKGELMQEKHVKQQLLRKKMKKQLNEIQRRKWMFEAHVNPSFAHLFLKATQASNLMGSVAMQIDKDPRAHFKGFKQGITKTPTMPWRCISNRAVQIEDPQYYRTDQVLQSAPPRRGSALANERPCTHVNHISPAYCEACNAPRKVSERRMMEDLEYKAQTAVADLWTQAIDAVE
jgi:hypothetical protein